MVSKNLPHARTINRQASGVVVALCTPVEHHGCLPRRSGAGRQSPKIRSGNSIVQGPMIIRRLGWLLSRAARVSLILSLWPGFGITAHSEIHIPWKVDRAGVQSLSKMLEHTSSGDHRSAHRAAQKLGGDFVILAEWLRLRYGCVSRAEVNTFLHRNSEWPSPVARVKTAVATSMAQVRPECNRLRKGEVFLNYSALPKDALASVANSLLWKKKIQEAEYIVEHLASKDSLATTARIDFKRNKKDPGGLAMPVLASVGSTMDFGLVYDYMAWYIKNKKINEEVLRTIAAIPKNRRYNKELWHLYRLYVGDIVYYRLAEFYRAAYALAADYITIGDAETLPEVHWLLGWIALKSLKDHESAYQHFSDFHSTARTNEQLSKAAYWAGHAAKKLGRTSVSLEWFGLAALHKTTFYGQLSLMQLGVVQIRLYGHNGQYSREHYLHCKNNTSAKIGYMLSLARQYEIADLFLQHAIERASSPEVAGMITELASSSGNVHSALKVAAAIEPKFLLPESLYPRHYLVADDNQEIVLSIIRQESKFDQKAKSPANAIGLMQLLPSTAMEVAKDLRVEYSESSLTDPEYNVMLGHHYLKKLLKTYNNSLVLALAAYNAGPRNVNMWIRHLGDPRRLSEPAELALWIESVPFNETRTYLQKVLANLQVYNGMSGKSMTLS
ncbi:MAG: lytic transglycosylase domain-containing protein [Anaplasma sp.]